MITGLVHVIRDLEEEQNAVECEQSEPKSKGDSKGQAAGGEKSKRGVRERGIGACRRDHKCAFSENG